MIEVSEFVQVVILAIVQGVAEFLPISSSGHLVAVEALLGNPSDNTELAIVLHFGTLLAILLYYRTEILELIRDDKRIVVLLVIGTIPAAVLGLYLKANYEWLLKDALVTGFMLVVTGFILMAITKIRPGEKTCRNLTIGMVLLIGMAQAFALLPGISRSGSTIVMGAMTGLKRQAAATFSFLLAIPAILGASILELRDIVEHGSATPVSHLVIGMLVAFGVGYFSLVWLMDWIKKGRLHWFAYWLLPFGFFMVVWQLYVILQNQAA